jgi:hypothetical protein
MDPIIAFSLAGTILQFVDSGSRFVLLAHRLYRSAPDAAVDHRDLLKITYSLNTILPELQKAHSDGDIDKSLGQLARGCSMTAVQLLAILDKVKAADISRKRDALKVAFRLIYKEDEIKSLQDRLASFRSQLNLHLLLSIR